jgi:deoxyribodipyrimidine photolyase-related protein
MKAYIIYPHQLYEPQKMRSIFCGERVDYVFLVEEFLYFKHFDFHPIKIKFHQDSMHAYKLELEEYFESKDWKECIEKNSIKTPKIIYIKSEELTSIEKLIDILKDEYEISEIVTHDPTDDWLKTKTEKYIDKINKNIELDYGDNFTELEKNKINIIYLNSPNFIFTENEIREYFAQGNIFY